MRTTRRLHGYSSKPWVRVDMSRPGRTTFASHAGGCALHLAVDGKQSRRHLGERGPVFYHAHLLSITGTLPGLEARSSISADGLDVLLGTIGQLCRQLQAHWRNLTDFCDPIPKTLIHGDCLPKNIHIRRTDDETEASFFDWGGAGWDWRPRTSDCRPST